jgi:hypothetical protein
MDEPPVGGVGEQLPHSVETGGSSHVSLIEFFPRLMQAKSMKYSSCVGESCMYVYFCSQHEAVYSSQTARCHKSEDYTMYLQCHENLKYHLYISLYQSIATCRVVRVANNCGF